MKLLISSKNDKIRVLVLDNNNEILFYDEENTANNIQDMKNNIYYGQIKSIEKDGYKVKYDKKRQEGFLPFSNSNMPQLTKNQYILVQVDRETQDAIWLTNLIRFSSANLSFMPNYPKNTILCSNEETRNSLSVLHEYGCLKVNNILSSNLLLEEYENLKILWKLLLENKMLGKIYVYPSLLRELNTHKWFSKVDSVIVDGNNIFSKQIALLFNGRNITFGHNIFSPHEKALAVLFSSVLNIQNIGYLNIHANSDGVFAKIHSNLSVDTIKPQMVESINRDAVKLILRLISLRKWNGIITVQLLKSSINEELNTLRFKNISDELDETLKSDHMIESKIQFQINDFGILTIAAENSEKQRESQYFEICSLCHSGMVLSRETVVDFLTRELDKISNGFVDLMISKEIAKYLLEKYILSRYTNINFFVTIMPNVHSNFYKIILKNSAFTRQEEIQTEIIKKEKPNKQINNFRASELENISLYDSEEN